MAAVTVVCGPPGAGKSRWVAERAAAGDLIVDVDALYQALSGLPMYEKPPGLWSYVFAARDAVLTRMEEAREIAGWIVTMGARRAEREALRSRFDAQVVVLEASTMLCLERISQDERRAGQLAEWLPRVVRWWREYERDERDTVIAESQPWEQ